MRTTDCLRKRAEECREHARFVRDPELQAQWLDMAETWLKLACDPQGFDAAPFAVPKV